MPKPEITIFGFNFDALKISFLGRFFTGALKGTLLNPGSILSRIFKDKTTLANIDNKAAGPERL